MMISLIIFLTQESPLISSNEKYIDILFIEQEDAAKKLVKELEKLQKEKKPKGGRMYHENPKK